MAAPPPSLRQVESHRKALPVWIAYRKEGGSWVYVPSETLAAIQQACFDGRAEAEVPLTRGQMHRFDLSNMTCIDLQDASRKAVPIVWIDSRNRVLTNIGAGTKKEIVKRTFVDGVDGNVVVTAVRCCDMYWPRFAEFAEQKHLLGNCEFAWYAASAAEAKSAAAGNGIVKVNSEMLGAGQAHGGGAHLSPLKRPYRSAMMAEVDEKGEAHVVLCSAVLGRQEAVRAGSSQSQPSSLIYESGVDNMSNPNWFIIWNGRMNSRILPGYVVSFIKSPELHTRGPAPLGSLSFSVSESSRIPKLYEEIKELIPSSKLHALEKCCDSYMKKECDMKQFVKSLCVLGGADLFLAVAKRIAKKC